MQPHLYRAMCLKTSTLSNLSEIFSQLPSHPPPRRAICHLSTITLMPYTFLNPSLFFPFLITVSSSVFFTIFSTQNCLPILHIGRVMDALTFRICRVTVNTKCKHKFFFLWLLRRARKEVVLNLVFFIMS